MRIRRLYIHARRNVTLKPWQEQVNPEYGSVSGDQLRNCQAHLSETDTGTRENEIRYLNRYHGIIVLPQAGPPLMLGILGLLVTLGTLVIRHAGSYGYEGPETHIRHNLLAWYVPPLIGLCFMACAVPLFYFLTYRWRHTYIMITNLALRLMVLPPPRSYIITLDIDDNDLNKIESVDIKQSRFGKYFGFGDITVQQIGGAKKFLIAVKNPLLVKEILDTARRTDQPRIPGLEISDPKPVAHPWSIGDTQPIRPVR